MLHYELILRGRTVGNWTPDVALKKTGIIPKLDRSKSHWSALYPLETRNGWPSLEPHVP